MRPGAQDLYIHFLAHTNSDTMTFLGGGGGRGPVRCKIVVDNKCLQGNNFKNLGYEKEKGTQQKLAKSAQILGILNNALKQTLVEKVQRIKVYNTLALPIILYGNEVWTLKEKD
jgi:hypothetical protein